ncbi:MAG: ABC transporter permease [Vicinamibacterales bacterium]
MKYAIRTLLKSPGFTAIAVVTIALGIAANTAIFSVVNGVLLQPLPFRDEARIVKVTTSTSDEPESNFSAADFLDVRHDSRSLESLAGYREDVVAVSAREGQPVQVQGAWVTASFFDALGTPPALGSTFSGARNAAPGDALVVIGHAAWQRVFGGDAGIVGRRVRIGGADYTVAAVMPRQFEWPARAEIWLLSPKTVPPSPLDLANPEADREVRYFQAIARLKPGLTLAAAGQELHQIAETMQKHRGADSPARDMHAIAIRDEFTGNVRDALLIMQAAVGLVLLIACANVSSLLIARATGRRRELAIRAALGATRWHLVRQLLAESLLLGFTGGAAGLLLSAWLVKLLLLIAPRTLPRADAITLDGTVMVVTIAGSLASGMLFGIIPALQASRARAGHVIKESGERGSTRTRGRAALVVGEIALTLVLLVGAGLLANSFLRLQRVDPGFTPEQATVGHLMMPQARYPKAADQTRVYRRLLEGLSEQPELQAVGVGFPGPLRAGSASGSFFVEGYSSPSGDKPFANLASVSGGYFAAMGIPLIGGRTFQDRDVANAPPVAVVSASMAKKYWPGESPIGKHLRFDDAASEPWITVVGVAGNARQLGLAKEPPALVYLPFEQFPLPFMSVTARSALPVGAVASLMKAAIARIDPDLPLGDIAPLASTVSRSIEEPRFRAFLIGIFAVLALVLAAVGLYGLISYTVTQRTREIGIRVALGAAPRQVLLPVIREGVTLALAGIALGLVGAFAAARTLSAFLFGVQAGDPLTFSAVALLLLIVAMTASYIPSRRALKVDPVVALRAE